MSTIRPMKSFFGFRYQNDTEHTDGREKQDKKETKITSKHLKSIEM